MPCPLVPSMRPLAHRRESGCQLDLLARRLLLNVSFNSRRLALCKRPSHQGAAQRIIHFAVDGISLSDSSELVAGAGSDVAT